LRGGSWDESQLGIERHRIRCRVEPKRISLALAAAVVHSGKNQRASDPSPVELRQHEEAAKVPEVLRQYDTNDSTLGSALQMTALLRMFDRPSQIAERILGHLRAHGCVGSNRGRDDPSNQVAELRHILRRNGGDIEVHDSSLTFDMSGGLTDALDGRVRRHCSRGSIAGSTLALEHPASMPNAKMM